jgi:hypothetical protein
LSIASHSTSRGPRRRGGQTIAFRSDCCHRNSIDKHCCDILIDVVDERNERHILLEGNRNSSARTASTTRDLLDLGHARVDSAGIDDLEDVLVKDTFAISVILGVSTVTDFESLPCRWDARIDEQTLLTDCQPEQVKNSSGVQPRGRTADSFSNFFFFFFSVNREPFTSALMAALSSSLSPSPRL